MGITLIRLFFVSIMYGCDVLHKLPDPFAHAHPASERRGGYLFLAFMWFRISR